MKRTSLFATILSLATWAMHTPALAEDKAKNLKVLQDNGKQLQNGMKALSKGLGVKCESCHVKGQFDSDKVSAKEDARKFLTDVVGVSDQSKRDEALKALLPSLKLKTAKHADEIWKGVDMFKKKS